MTGIRVRVATLNVHMWHKAAPDHSPNQKQVARMLGGEDFDVLVLQEAQGAKHYSKWLVESIGFEHCAFASTLMLLSRYPLVEKATVTLPRSRELLSTRLLVSAVHEDKPEVTIDVHVTHLCHMDEDSYETQPPPLPPPPPPHAHTCAARALSFSL